MSLLKRIRIIGSRVPIHWIMVFTIFFSVVITVLGGVAIVFDVRDTLARSRENLTHSQTMSEQTDHLIKVYLPIWQTTKELKLSIERFSLEFDLFVAREDGQINALDHALTRMLEAVKQLKSSWTKDLPESELETLIAHIRMTIGIYEEAAEFEQVGFGEIYRLAEESKDAVASLISAVQAVEKQLETIALEASARVSQKAGETLSNDRRLTGVLGVVLIRHLAALIVILLSVIASNILFFILLKDRLAVFSNATQSISDQIDLSLRVTLPSKDEFGDLALSFNRMLEQLQMATDSEAFLNNLIESIMNMILVTNAQGTIVMSNSRVAKIIGLSKDTLYGRNIFEFIIGKRDTDAEYLRSTPNIHNHEGVLLTVNKEEIPVLITKSPLISGKGGQTGDSIITITDITDRLLYEKDKLSAQKAAAEQSKYALVGQVAGKLAHDFNNVLGIILGNAELALLECDDENIRETLELVLNQALRGKNLTKNLVAFAKSSEPKHDLFNIDDKIDFVTNLLKKDLSGIEVVKDYNSHGIDLIADPGMIEHTLVNLIQNAIHATCRCDNPKIILRTHTFEQKMFIEVEDNGCGIPDEHIETIYEPSFTLKGSRDATGSYIDSIKGTGYGLANVKKYIEQHKGEIFVQSEFGKGSTFTISIPIITRHITTRELQKSLMGNIHSGRSILLVEDEPFISDVQYKLLTRAPLSHQVDIAPNADTAIRLFDSKAYDLISLDYILPGKLNGMDVYEYIRQKNQKIQVLFISGNLEFLESIADLRHKDNNIDHLSKPYQISEYVNAVNRAIDRADL